MSDNQLVTKATHGRLSTRELQQVAQGLASGNTDPYEALLVIGRANATQYRNLVDKYLQCREDPMLARLALQVLCRYWGLTAEYQEELDRFAHKVDWDEDDDIRLMAIDCIGSFLAENKVPRLLSLLLQIFRNDSERQIVREAAYCSLALAAGKQAGELPSASRHFDLEHDVDCSVIAFAEATLQKP
jgi:hypothetical protein